MEINLITGKSGFLGKIIADNFSENDFKLLSLGRNKNDDFQFDLLSEKIILTEKINTVIHCAGKAHMLPVTELEKQEFFNVNVKGTQALLKALEAPDILPKHFIFISTVAVYGKDTGADINEDNPLLATDPYGLSKIQAEQIVQDWCKTYGVICTILRLPLIAGPNPPGNLHSMIDGIKKGYYFNIAGGKAKKSIVLASDVAKIIPQAAVIGGIYNLTDGYHPSFYELSNVISKQLNKKLPHNLPYSLAKIIALLGDIMHKKIPINSDKLYKVTMSLTFNDSKARKLLGWQPMPVLEGLKVN